MSTYLKEDITYGEENVEILIEVDEAESEARLWGSHSYGNLRGGEKGDVSLTTRTFEKGMALIRTCAEQVADTMQKIDQTISPDEVEVKFGVKLTGEAGALIAKKGAEAHMEVAFKWNSATKLAS